MPALQGPFVGWPPSKPVSFLKDISSPIVQFSLRGFAVILFCLHPAPLTRQVLGLLPSFFGPLSRFLLFLPHLLPPSAIARPLRFLRSTSFPNRPCWNIFKIPSLSRVTTLEKVPAAKILFALINKGLFCCFLVVSTVVVRIRPFAECTTFFLAQKQGFYALCGITFFPGHSSDLSYPFSPVFRLRLDLHELSMPIHRRRRAS